MRMLVFLKKGRSFRTISRSAVFDSDGAHYIHTVVTRDDRFIPAILLLFEIWLGSPVSSFAC